MSKTLAKMAIGVWSVIVLMWITVLISILILSLIMTLIPVMILILVLVIDVPCTCRLPFGGAE